MAFALARPATPWSCSALCCPSQTRPSCTADRRTASFVTSWPRQPASGERKRGACAISLRTVTSTCSDSQRPSSSAEPPRSQIQTRCLSKQHPHRDRARAFYRSASHFPVFTPVGLRAPALGLNCSSAPGFEPWTTACTRMVAGFFFLSIAHACPWHPCKTSLPAAKLYQTWSGSLCEPRGC